MWMADVSLFSQCVNYFLKYLFATSERMGMHASFAKDSENASQALIAGINAIHFDDVYCRSRYYVAFYKRFYDYLIEQSVYVSSRGTPILFLQIYRSKNIKVVDYQCPTREF